MPELLEHDGLVAALSQLAETIQNRTSMTIGVALCEEPSLTLDAKAAIYRTAQEDLRNATTHAEANHLRLQLFEEGETIVLEVDDDGIGFDLNRTFPGRLGLRSMHERIELLGGSHC